MPMLSATTPSEALTVLVLPLDLREMESTAQVYDMVDQHCILHTYRALFFSIAIIPPVEIVRDDRDLIEPGREFSVVCVSSGIHRGQLSWIQLPSEEQGKISWMTRQHVEMEFPIPYSIIML